MSDEDFDVWLMNTRGNTYSTNHTMYGSFDSRSRKNREKYWSFSNDEIGYYDLPACIDYILHKTEQSKVHYIGHSLGSTVFFIMASDRPEYNAKIEMMHALAPPVFLQNTIFPIRMVASSVSLIHVRFQLKYTVCNYNDAHLQYIFRK